MRRRPGVVHDRDHRRHSALAARSGSRLSGSGRRPTNEASISSYGFPLRGRQATFPLDRDAEFGIEVTIDGWWGRPWPAAVGFGVGDVVVFAIDDPDRFAEDHSSDSGVEELEGSALELTLEPEMRPDGLWSFTLEEAAVYSVLRF